MKQILNNYPPDQKLKLTLKLIEERANDKGHTRWSDWNAWKLRFWEHISEIFENSPHIPQKYNDVARALLHVRDSCVDRRSKDDYARYDNNVTKLKLALNKLKKTKSIINDRTGT